eukprot:scaffold7082_cov350-Prasinococcus_capsulatus_cf.AAC.3
MEGARAPRRRVRSTRLPTVGSARTGTAANTTSKSAPFATLPAGWDWTASRAAAEDDGGAATTWLAGAGSGISPCVGTVCQFSVLPWMAWYSRPCDVPPSGGRVSVDRPLHTPTRLQTWSAPSPASRAGRAAARGAGTMGLAPPRATGAHPGRALRPAPLCGTSSWTGTSRLTGATSPARSILHRHPTSGQPPRSPPAGCGAPRPQTEHRAAQQGSL